jgi:hypothetical protein
MKLVSTPRVNDAAPVACFARNTNGQKETRAEREFLKNGGGCHLPPNFEDLPKGSPERKAAFAASIVANPLRGAL